METNPLSKQKSYRLNYLSRIKRKEVIFTKDEYSRVLKKAEEYGCSVTEYIKLCAFSSLESKPLLYNANLINAIFFEIRRIGNNVNQISRVVNAHKALPSFDSMRLLGMLKSLELYVKQMLGAPPELINLITDAMSKDPYFMYQIELLIFNLKNDCQIKNMEIA